MRDPPLLHQTVELLARLDRRSAHKYRLALRMAPLNLVHQGLKLIFLGEENVVLLILPDHGLIGGDSDNRRTVGLPELGVGALGRTRHTRELVVEAKIVLQCDRRHSHGLIANLHTLLGFDGLVEAL